ncbi:MAG: DUF3592 domain-containing protein [Goleter apudmare HA4340-LM2]|nr:DUF3592 domain-containing protein [Goleter apudmare HA4340-LM2]
MAVISTLLTYRFINTASKAKGQVVRVYAGGSHPVIRFVPKGEEAIEFSQKMGFPHHFKMGDKIDVLYLYDPQNPARFQTTIDTPAGLWFPTIALVGVGGGLIIGGLYMKYVYNPQ